jgi:hypothetical protein
MILNDESAERSYECSWLDVTEQFRRAQNINEPAVNRRGPFDRERRFPKEFVCPRADLRKS